MEREEAIGLLAHMVEHKTEWACVQGYWWSIEQVRAFAQGY